MNIYIFALLTAAIGVLTYAWFKLLGKYGRNNL